MDKVKLFSNPALPEIHNLGNMAFDPIFSEKMHINKRCEMLRVCRGNMELFFEDRSFKASAGDILFVPAGISHRDEFDMDDGLDIFYCSFNWDDAEEYFKYIDNDKLLSLSQITQNRLNTMFDLLRSDLGRGSDIDRKISSVRVLEVFLVILREISYSDSEGEEESNYSSRRQKLLAEARNYVKRNYASPLSLDDIASKLDISTYYLSHIFSEESEFSYSAYLTNVRMEKARELLLDSKNNISEVAAKVGFESANYFTKVFKKNTGMSPKQYIAENG
ncbi:MAG: AraC family transcriptional regulator [Planctomycetota bacterium]